MTRRFGLLRPLRIWDGFDEQDGAGQARGAGGRRSPSAAHRDSWLYSHRRRIDDGPGSMTPVLLAESFQ